jgi:hypothetical protein
VLTHPFLDVDANPVSTAAHGEETPVRYCDTGLFDDVPGGVWKIFLGLWVTLFGLFALFFATDRSATFAIIISCMFAMMAFGLPIAMAAQSRSDRPPSVTIYTCSGPLSAWEAGAQIISIPAAAVTALTAFILFAK